MSLGAITRTVDDVLRHIKRQFGDESGAQITNEDITTWLNNGQREIASLSKCIEKRATTDIVGGVYEYTLPTEAATDIVSIRFNGVTLRGVTFQQFETDYVDSDPLRIQQADPQVWTMWGNTITLWPTPSVDITAGLTVYYIGVPANVAVAGDLLTVPDLYYEALCYFILSKAYEMDEDYSTSADYMDRFRGRLDVDDSREDTPEIFYPSITITDWD